MSDWERRWQEGQIGFHQARPSWALERYGATAFADPKARILVPLAGKTLDMLWLEGRGHEVVGVELVELAVRSFFEENQRTPEVTPLADVPGRRFAAGRITLLAADVFDVRAHHTGPLGGVFDRAALIALPEAQRRRYVPHVSSLLSEGSRILLVGLDYDPDAMSGPPYRVPDQEITQLFQGLGVLKKLEERDALADNPRFAERGLRRLTESVYLFEKQT